MDWTSPGLPSPVCGGLGVVDMTEVKTCIVDYPAWPFPQPTCPVWIAPVAPVPLQVHPYYFVQYVPTKLSDDDVDRIARRLAELMKEPK